MCTALTYGTKNHFFGRNLDLERRYSESVTITPRNYIFNYKKERSDSSHYAIIGMATVVNNYPLYYDATNEYGLSMAGLNFVGNAYYGEEIQEKINLAPYELIPYLLGKCKNIKEVYPLLENINLINLKFNNELPIAELHWIISDKKASIVLENTREGMMIYNNPIGVLTNNPPFSYHLQNLSNYLNLTNKEAKNRFSDKITLDAYSRGMGGIGLPGDFSSASRFVKASFVKLNSPEFENNIDGVTQMFHILNSTEQVEGSVIIGDKFERTQYSSCCDMDNCIYYYKTYENNQITAVKMTEENMYGDELFTHDIISTQQIKYIN